LTASKAPAAAAGKRRQARNNASSDGVGIRAASTAAGVQAEPDLLAHAKQSLDTAKELDEEFGEILREAVYYSNPRMLRQLYRSRFRLLRGFSGLWLIYDRGQTPATA